ncbi:MAG: hypothetical protein A6D91_08665 [Bacillaceae bacterium G1]|nr:MAG: hypothetical protein A6D91_08665 [Bacillaceae bacterium G1]
MQWVQAFALIVLYRAGLPVVKQSAAIQGIDNPMALKYDNFRQFPNSPVFPLVKPKMFSSSLIQTFA